MSTVQHTLRLPKAVDQALRKHAAAREVTPYALLQLSVRTGLTALLDEHTQSHLLREMEIGRAHV